MDSFSEILISVIIAVIASSGFWAFLINRLNKKDVRTELLMGLAHDRIVTLGMLYLERGYITKDEYENLHNYLYAPYKKMGGDEDSSAAKIMDHVCKLPIRSDSAIIVDLQK